MKRILLTLTIFLTPILAEFQGAIYPIDTHIQSRMMHGNSWQAGCPVAIDDLRYLQMTYIDFDGVEQMGELIVHQTVANEMVAIFGELYSIGYPIRQMRLVSDFNGNDWQSIEADNTSAFNCRQATGSKKWSRHAYGKAVDINPLENPYISRKGYISHKASLPYRKRVHRNSSAADRAILLREDLATQIFKRYGYFWGGDWRTIKDYQHFEK